MKTTSFACLSACLLLSGLTTAEKVQRSSIKLVNNNDKVDGWAFLHKFAFTSSSDGSNAGYLKVTLYFESSPNVNMLLYDDEEEHWPKVEGECAQTCLVKEGFANIKTPMVTGVSVEIEIKEKSRPRWWWVVVSDCTGTVKELEYELEFRNDYETGDDDWNNEFGHNERGLNTVYVLFWLANLGCLIGQSISVYKRHKLEDGEVPGTVISFTTGVVATVISDFCFMIYWTNFGNTGLKVDAGQDAGIFFQIVAQTAMVTCLCFLATGWNFGSEGMARKMFIIIVIVCEFFLELALWFGYRKGLNDEHNDWFYHSDLGGVTVAFAVLIAVWFGVEIYTFHDQVPQEKKGFYLRFGVAYFFWLMLIPIIVWIAFGIPSFSREYTVGAIHNTFNLLARVGLIYTLWPSVSRALFHEMDQDHGPLSSRLVDPDYNASMLEGGAVHSDSKQGGRGSIKHQDDALL